MSQTALRTPPSPAAIDLRRPYRFRWLDRTFTTELDDHHGWPCLVIRCRIGPLPFTAEGSDQRAWLIGETQRRRSGCEGVLSLDDQNNLVFAMATLVPDGTDVNGLMTALVLCLMQIEPYLTLLCGRPIDLSVLAA